MLKIEAWSLRSVFRIIEGLFAQIMSIESIHELKQDRSISQQHENLVYAHAWVRTSCSFKSSHSEHSKSSKKCQFSELCIGLKAYCFYEELSDVISL